MGQDKHRDDEAHAAQSLSGRSGSDATDPRLSRDPAADLVPVGDERQNGSLRGTGHDPDPDHGAGHLPGRDEACGGGIVPCFTPDTLIATPRGERKVSDLVAGDRIITRDNGMQEIRWIGRKDVGREAMTAERRLRPVLIRRGALGNGLPERDMMVSPNHRVLIVNDRAQFFFEEREILVPAKHLLGRPGIEIAGCAPVSYMHLMFDHHEVVLSDGVWTESFQPGAQVLKGIGASQRDEVFGLFPELRQEAGLAGYGTARRTLRQDEASMLLK